MKSKYYQSTGLTAYYIYAAIKCTKPGAATKKSYDAKNMFAAMASIMADDAAAGNGKACLGYHCKICNAYHLTSHKIPGKSYYILKDGKAAKI